MKFIRFFAASLIVAVMFTACSKDKDNAPPASSFNIVGLWEGKIGTGAAIPSGQFAIQIKQNGQIDRLNSEGEVSGTGTWTLEGTAFKAEYTTNSGTIIKISATLDKVLERLSGGKWENSGGNQGTWFATQK